MNISRRAYGLDTKPSEVSVEVLDRVSSGMAYICTQDIKKQKMDCYGCIQREQFPNEREDGWMEIKLGEFFTGEDDEEVKMSLMEVKGYQLKGGLVIEGIEVRPI